MRAPRALQFFGNVGRCASAADHNKRGEFRTSVPHATRSNVPALGWYRRKAAAGTVTGARLARRWSARLSHGTGSRSSAADTPSTLDMCT